jgi:hypothetical protein
LLIFLTLSSIDFDLIGSMKFSLSSPALY